ncbi:MAG: ABC transporter substrate-binding protein [Chloroflexota bacterium]|nr:ABC transporter substrate-binding protein [Chloroflexota bacterium]
MRRALAAIALGATILGACGGAAAPSASASPAAVASAAASAAASPSAAPFALTAATPTTSSAFLWAYLAEDSGIFKSNGLNVDLKYIRSTEAVTALIAGQIDVSLGAGSDVLNAAVNGGDLVVVAVPTPTYPFVFEVAPGITKAADLKGKKIGVSSLGSSSDIATRVALKKLGLDPDTDVTIVAVGSAASRTAAAVSGAIQGAVSLVPDDLVLEDKGWKPLVNLAELGLPAVQNTVTVRRDFLTAHRDVVQRFIDSMVIAIARAKKDKTASLASLAKWSKLTDPRLAGAAYTMSTTTYPALPYPTVALFADSVSELSSKNPKVKGFDVSKIIDGSFVKSAADRGLDKR